MDIETNKHVDIMKLKHVVYYHHLQTQTNRKDIDTACTEYIKCDNAAVLDDGASLSMTIINHIHLHHGDQL